jgi:hypothetical protein
VSVVAGARHSSSTFLSAEKELDGLLADLFIRMFLELLKL